MDALSQQIFQTLRGRRSALLAAGFKPVATQLMRQQPLLDTFQLTIVVTLPNTVTTTLIDTETQQPYTLHLDPQNTGKFVAKVREAYLAALKAVATAAFTADPFHSAQVRKLTQVITDRYHDQLAFLWPKFPNNAVWRRTDTHKWYALLVKIPQSKLGLPGDDLVTVIDFRLEPTALAQLVDNQTYFPGYHMNKAHWYSLILDHTISNEELLNRLETSYQLAK